MRSPEVDTDELLDFIPARARPDRLRLVPSTVSYPGCRLLGSDDVIHRMSSTGYEGELRLVALGGSCVVDELALVERHNTVSEPMEQPHRDFCAANVAGRIGLLGLVRALLEAHEGVGIGWTLPGSFARAMNQ